jgi:hypothetical protein
MVCEEEFDLELDRLNELRQHVQLECELDRSGLRVLTASTTMNTDYCQEI